MVQRVLRAVVAPTEEDPLCIALSLLVNRDLMDSAMHPDEEIGWTPLTIQFARRLRELGRKHRIWGEEPELIRGVLDGVWR